MKVSIKRNGLCLSLLQMKIIALIFLSAEAIFLCLSEVITMDIPLATREILSDLELVAIPVLAFTVVQDFLLKNMWKCVSTLFVIGLFSEIPYGFLHNAKGIDLHNNNIFLYLAVGVVVIWLISFVEKWGIKKIAKGKNRYFVKDMAEIIVYGMMFFLLPLIIDYLSFNGIMAISLIVGIYLFRPNPIKAVLLGLGFMILVSRNNGIVLFMFIGVVPFFFYHEKDNEEKAFMPYMSYPVILAFFSVIRMLISKYI